MSRNPSELPIDELLEQLKNQLPEPLFATVSKKFLALQYAELKIQVLEERLRLKRIQMYGPGSEKLTNEQLELLELEPGVSTAEVQAESVTRTVACASSGEKSSPSSGPPGAAGGTAAGRAGDRVHGRAVRVRRLRP